MEVCAKAHLRINSRTYRREQLIANGAQGARRCVQKHTSESIDALSEVKLIANSVQGARVCVKGRTSELVHTHNEVKNSFQMMCRALEGVSL